MTDSTKTLVVSIIGSLVIGIQIGYLVTKMLFERHMIKSGAAYWKLNSNGKEELALINGKEMETIMLHIVYKKPGE